LLVEAVKSQQEQIRELREHVQTLEERLERAGLND